MLERVERDAAVEMPPALVRQPSSLAARRQNHEESPRSRAIRIFSKVDVIDDGSVTLAELKAYLATHEAMGFKSLDDETTAKMFSALDVNHDGTVSLEEWAAVIARAAVAPEFKEASALAAAPPAPPLSRPARSPARGRPGSGFSVPVAAASASRATPTVPATQLSQEQACAVLAVMCAVLLWGVSLTTHALTDYACTRFVLALAPYVAVTIVALFAKGAAAATLAAAFGLTGAAAAALAAAFGLTGTAAAALAAAFGLTGLARGTRRRGSPSRLPTPRASGATRGRCEQNAALRAHASRVARVASLRELGYSRGPGQLCTLVVRGAPRQQPAPEQRHPGAAPAAQSRDADRAHSLHPRNVA